MYNLRSLSGIEIPYLFQLFHVLLVGSLGKGKVNFKTFYIRPKKQQCLENEEISCTCAKKLISSIERYFL